MTPTRKPRKQAGLPRRTPKNPQRRGSRSPTPPLDSRVTSFASTISSTSSSSLRRQSSVSSFSSSDSSSSDTASPLFSPVDLPQAVAVAGTDFPFDNDGSGFSFALPPTAGKADDVQIMFPTGFGTTGEEFSFFDDLGFGFQMSG
ncbi:hypothetical protein PM082_003168 [Marasmius tenuissimus]|nr:hypothetical protein PM082_003168 [Marasmius tenuissimus]